MTSFEEFTSLAEQGTFVPVCKEIAADLLTPVSAFMKIAEHSEYSFLLESVEGGERSARYSFLGKDPFIVLRSRRGQTIIDRNGVRTESQGKFIDTLREMMTELKAPTVPGLPRFTGGAVGYMGYDTAAWFESVPLKEGASDEDDAGFMMCDTVLAFDHVGHRILIIANARITTGQDLETLYRFACTKIRFLERELGRALSTPVPSKQSPLTVTSNVTRARYEEMIGTAKQYIAAGDIYQVVPSQRFETPFSADSFSAYRALRRINPSPYMYYLRMGGRAIVGSSPEMLVRVEGKVVQTHPIAGTRPRGDSENDDERLAVELASDEKERAEHVMLVDLGRNDVGRVSAYGTVQVPAYMKIERYSHVMHLVSIVQGELADGRDRLDALASCFPAGTVSGAPKIRAMEIIAELEDQRRGVYAGAVGYLDFAGNLDFCIAIRTVVIEGGRAFIQAGGGIVADSVPAVEYEETRAKARAVLAALEMAQKGL
jgi:anthranilate synthase component 1